MSASEFTTLDRILKQHEDELIDEALAELPPFIVERRFTHHVREPRHGARAVADVWSPTHGRMALSLRPLSYYVLTERFVDGDVA